MKKRVKGRKFGRERSQRKALLKGLARNLILVERMETTEAKAKELAGFLAKQITRAKKDTIQTRRLLSQYFSNNIIKKLITDIAPRYAQRQGGYTRIIKLGPRRSNGARMAVIELVGGVAKEEKKVEEPKAKKVKTKS